MQKIAVGDELTSLAMLRSSHGMSAWGRSRPWLGRPLLAAFALCWICVFVAALDFFDANLGVPRDSAIDPPWEENRNRNPALPLLHSEKDHYRGGTMSNLIGSFRKACFSQSIHQVLGVFGAFETRYQFLGAADAVCRIQMQNPR